jgi:DNA-3-methyladenine glycosylase
VLLRAGEVITGIEDARDRRGTKVTDRDLARGPGRLAQALGITRADNGTDLLGGAAITLTPPERPVTKINSGPRVGITKNVDLAWRFWIADDPYVSTYRPGVVRVRRRDAT